MSDPETWRKSPTLRGDDRCVVKQKAQESRISAVFRTWHASCKVLFIGRTGRLTDQIGDFEMTGSTTLGQRLLAGIAAFGMTTFLIVASFSTPSAFIVQGIVA
jgi:hypothetical protein